MIKDTTFLTVKDIARYLNLKELAVYRLLKEGKIDHFKFGRQIRVKKEDFEIADNNTSSPFSLLHIFPSDRA